MTLLVKRKDMGIYVTTASCRGNFSHFAGKAELSELLVTGATSQIGFSIMKELLFRHPTAKAIVASRDRSKLESRIGNLPVEIRKRTRIVDLPTQVDDLASFNREIENIDCALVCQGAYGQIGHFKDLNLNLLLKSFESQLKTLLLTLKSLASLTKEKRRKIIVLGGGGASQGYAGLSEYGMFKSSMARLVETISLENAGESFSINFLGPGPVYSKMSEDIIAASASGAQIDRRILQASLELGSQDPEPIAQVVDACEYLFSKEARQVSGRFISAHWDNPLTENQILDNDAFRLRRIIPTS